MKSFTLVSLLVAAAAVHAAPFVSKVINRPTGPPPTAAKLIAYIAGTDTPFGYLASNGSLIPLPQATPQEINPHYLSLAPVFTLAPIALGAHSRYNTTLLGPEGGCVLTLETDALDCTQEVPGEGIRIEPGIYGWSVSVQSDWWWYANPPLDAAAPREVHALYERVKGEAPFEVLAIPVPVTKTEA